MIGGGACQLFAFDLEWGDKSRLEREYEKYYNSNIWKNAGILCFLHISIVKQIMPLILNCNDVLMKKTGNRRRVLKEKSLFCFFKGWFSTFGSIRRALSVHSSFLSSRHKASWLMKICCDHCYGPSTSGCVWNKFICLFLVAGGFSRNPAVYISSSTTMEKGPQNKVWPSGHMFTNCYTRSVYCSLSRMLFYCLGTGLQNWQWSSALFLSNYQAQQIFFPALPPVLVWHLQKCFPE